MNTTIMSRQQEVNIGDRRRGWATTGKGRVQWRKEVRADEIRWRQVTEDESRQQMVRVGDQKKVSRWEHRGVRVDE